MPLIAGWLPGLTGDRPVGKRACPYQDNLAPPLCLHYSFLLLLAFLLLHCLPLLLTVYLSPSLGHPHFVANIGTIPGEVILSKDKRDGSRNWGRSQGGTSLCLSEICSCDLK